MKLTRLSMIDYWHDSRAGRFLMAANTHDRNTPRLDIGFLTFLAILVMSSQARAQEAGLPGISRQTSALSAQNQSGATGQAGTNSALGGITEGVAIPASTRSRQQASGKNQQADTSSDDPEHGFLIPGKKIVGDQPVHELGTRLGANVVQQPYAGTRLGGGTDSPSPEAVTTDPRDSLDAAVVSLTDPRTTRSPY